jgi:hypothetical protein
MNEVEKYEIEKPNQVKVKRHPRNYYASDEDIKNPKLRSATPKKGAYKNILTWRK